MLTLGWYFTVAILLHFCGGQMSRVPNMSSDLANYVQEAKRSVLSEKELLSLVKKRVDPVYSEESTSIITRPRYGVFVSVEINTEGKVIAARAIRGPSLLKDAAIEAAKAWEFSPISGDEAVISGVINFGLPENYVRRDANHKLEQYEEDVQKNPSSSLAHCRLGTAYLLHNRHGKAIEEYQKAHLLQPTSPEVLYGLGMAYWSTGKLVQALTHFQQALEMKPDFVEAIYSIAGIYRDRGQINEAIDWFKRAIQVRPDLDVKGIVYLNLHSMYEKLGQEENAVLMLEESVKVNTEIRSLDPEDFDANPVYNLQKIADYYEKKERYEEAIKAYQRIVDFEPISPAAFRASIDMASLHKKLGRQSEAIAICEQLLNYVNSNPIKNSQGEADEMRGRIYMEMDRNQEAISYFKKAAAKKPSNSIRPNEYLYDLYLKVGNQKEAAKQKEIIKKFYEEWERPMREGKIIRVKP